MDQPISKTQKKREAEILQKLGMELVELSEEKLALFPLNDNLLEAIRLAKTLTSHGAKRRQAQLIGKLMRSSDFEAIQAAWAQFIEANSAKTASFHEAEVWRDRLIDEDQQVLTEFIALYQPQDIQKLRQLVKKAKDDRKNQKNTGGAKALFRFIRDYFQ